MKVYSRTATIPDITNAIGIATYGEVSQTLVVTNAMYRPIVGRIARDQRGPGRQAKRDCVDTATGERE